MLRKGAFHPDDFWSHLRFPLIQNKLMLIEDCLILTCVLYECLERILQTFLAKSLL
jgi:hypothetical protein